MKNFIITIDTEGDNLWEWDKKSKITTENAGYLLRFQELCNTYHFKPVWLCDWEMLHDLKFISFVMNEYENKNCEIGMHMHPWNTPPFYELSECKTSGLPYMKEYPLEIVEKKISIITYEFKRILGFKPVSHRAGRWGINDDIFELLFKYGYKIDCSITPGIDWSDSVGQMQGVKGPDYTNEIAYPTYRKGIMEVPMSTYESSEYYFSTWNSISDLKLRTKYLCNAIKKKKRVLYVRPDGTNIAEMKWIVNQAKEDENSDYLMFMLHSSELMPGGSPTFRDVKAIDRLYNDIGEIFKIIAEDYMGTTLNEYFEKRRDDLRSDE